MCFFQQNIFGVVIPSDGGAPTRIWMITLMLELADCVVPCVFFWVYAVMAMAISYNWL